MNMNKIVMMCAPARSGKDTLYPILKRNLANTYGGEWKRFAFADKLKQDTEAEVKKQYGVSVWDDSKKDIFRPYLIRYGKQRRDETDGRYLIDNFINTAQPSVNYIITDYRYHDEFVALQEHYRDIHPIYINRYIMRSGIKFNASPSIPSEIMAYPKIKEHAKVLC